MTKLLTPYEEAEAIAKEHGIYVPPCKLSRITENAAKILNLLTKNNPAMTYQELLLTMDTVRNTLEQAGGQIR